MNKAFLLFTIPAMMLVAFGTDPGLTGVWEYGGGVYNGKADGAATSYKLLREYAKGHYKGILIAPGEDTLIYEKGDYRLVRDSCLETQTYSSQPSKVTGVTLRYHYRIKNDTLTFRGELPNGTTVQEYWKKVKQ